MAKVKIGNKEVDVAFDTIDIDIIRSKTPVQTGNLRDNFTLTIDGEIENPVDYADEVEFGTTSKPGVFMVERSLDEIGERLAERMADQINQPGLIKLPEIILKVGK